MNKIRLQFMLLLLSVIVLFAGMVVVDVLVYEQMIQLYRLETRVGGIMGKWNRMVGLSSGILSSDKPIAENFQDWKVAYDGFGGTWRQEVTDLEKLAGGDVLLLDQLSWVRGTMELGADQMESLSSSLEGLVNALDSQYSGSSKVQSLYKVLTNEGEDYALDTIGKYYLNRVQDTVRLFQDDMGPVLGKTQGRFEQQTAARIGELSDRFMYIRSAFLGLIMVLLVVFLIRIIKLNLNLMTLVKQRTSALDKALDDLKASQEMVLESRRQSAIATMIVGISHEINTPLGVLLTAISKMRDNHNDLSVLNTDQKLTRQYFQEYLDQQEELLDLSDANISRMRTMINHFRTLSVQEQALERHPVDICGDMAGWLAMLALEVQRKGHAYLIDCHVEGAVFTSPEAIVQVLRHLTQNSLEFAFPDGRVGSIRIGFRREGDALVIRHQDDGIGIPHDQLERVFEPFYTTGRAAGHMGLGLNIAHNMVTHLLGGTIGLERCEIGTLVIIRLPLGGENSPAISPG